jgi:hypothetical protein
VLTNPIHQFFLVTEKRRPEVEATSLMGLGESIKPKQAGRRPLGIG